MMGKGILFYISSAFLIFFKGHNDGLREKVPGRLLVRTYNCGERITNVPSSNFFVSECLFNAFTGSNQGGVIFLEDKIVNLSLSDTTFCFCGVTNMGGAIYFVCSTDSSLNMKKICASNCFAYYCHFAYVTTCKKYENIIHYIAISNCTNDKDDECSLAMIIYNQADHVGSYYISHDNFSYNRANSESCIRIAYTIDLIINYSTFFENHANTHGFISIRVRDYNFSVTSCNFVNNTQKNEGKGMIMIDCPSNYSYFSKCILSFNSNTLFEISSDSLFSIQECIINHDPNNFTKGPITMEFNNTVSLFSYIETHPIDHFDTYLCKAELPIRTPEYTPIITPFISPTFDVTKTFEETQIETIEPTFQETPDITPDMTPMFSPVITPIETPDKTPLDTPAITPINTPIETPNPTITSESFLKSEAGIAILSIGTVCIILIVILIFRKRDYLDNEQKLISEQLI